MADLNVCNLCGNARWVVASSGQPWHGQLPGGRPCPECNDDEGNPVGYNLTCLSANCEQCHGVDVAAWLIQNPDDFDTQLYRLGALGDEDLFAGVTAVNYMAMPKLDLIAARLTLRRELIRTGEMPLARTQRGRDLHSELAAATEALRQYLQH